jgi:hypothetical protein
MDLIDIRNIFVEVVNNCPPQLHPIRMQTLSWVTYGFFAKLFSIVFYCMNFVFILRHS